MKTIYRKFIKWSALKGVILYTGPFSNGKTLSAVRQIVESRDSKRIVSNAHLYSLPFIYLDSNVLGSLESLVHCRVLLDSPYSLVGSLRGGRSSVVRFMLYWLQQYRKRDNQIILTTSHVESLDRMVRELIGTVFEPRFEINKYGTSKITLVRLVYSKRTGKLVGRIVYPTVNAKKYFKYYNTNELPGGLPV